MSGVFTLGESMGLVRGDGLGGLEHLATAHLDTGGAEGNVAVGLARLGTASTWLGRVGDDAWGRRVAGDLRSEGVTVHAIVDPQASTGLMVKTTPRAGATVVDYYRTGSAGSRLDPADLADARIEEYGILHVTGITLGLSESARATVFAAIERARAAGTLVSFAVNHRSKMWSADEAATSYLRAAASADILFASEEEAGMLAPESGAESLARALAAIGPSQVLVTRGARGAVALIDGELHSVDALPVAVVDTVGAGDAFIAGYLAEHVAGAAPEQRLRTATIAGALACMHPGDWHGYPRRAELDSLHRDEPVTR